jgi:hypothetical protein
MDITSLRATLINTYHLQDLSEDKQNEMIDRIAALIFQAVLIRVLPMMSEEKQGEFEKLMEKDSTPDELMGFLQKQVPSLPEILKEEAENFKKESEAVMSQIGK